MKRLLTAAAIATAAVASGCATYDDTPYYTTNNPNAAYYYRSPVATGVVNPTYPVAEGDNNAVPYREYSMFFKDRGLHQDVPSALTPHVVVPPPTATQPAG